MQRLAPSFEVDPRLALAIVRSESNFQAGALSPKNAQGLMQLIPETAERFGVRDVWNPEQNVRGGLTYLRWLLDRFGGGCGTGLGRLQRGRKSSGAPWRRAALQRDARVRAPHSGLLPCASARAAGQGHGVGPAACNTHEKTARAVRPRAV